MSTPHTDCLPEVPGILTADEVLATAHSIAELQQPNGMILWLPGGHCDPWNHVEAAMALGICGLTEEMERAHDWLEATQLRDGSWFNYYLATSVKDPRLDTNVVAYVAAGVWHAYLLTGDRATLERRFPMVERAVDFVLRHQEADGPITWSRDQAGRREGYALLTGSSSIYHSLRCANAIAETLERPNPQWELSAGRLGHALAHHAGSFAPKYEFAMDWYYPMLSGALEGARAHARLEEMWDTFVIPGKGVRCVSTGDWVTAAETAECVMTLDALGLRDRALELLSCTAAHRRPDGSYFTGIAYPELVTYPDNEATTYTAAAIVMAADALSNTTAAAGLFRGETLGEALDLAGVACDGAAGDDCTGR